MLQKQLISIIIIEIENKTVEINIITTKNCHAKK